MAELATIARPYAEALFQAGASDKAFDVHQAQWLSELAAIAADADLLNFATDPRVESAQVFDLMAGLVKADMPDAGRNFLRTVVENRRLAALPEVARQFQALVNRGAGAREATVYSAFPMDEAALAQLAQTLAQRFGGKLETRVVVDEALIGGVRVVVGDEVLDTSVRARLDAMRTALMA